MKSKLCWVRDLLALVFVLALVLAPAQAGRAASPAAVNAAPGAPVLNWPADGGGNISTSPTLAVTVSGAPNLAVTFYGRPTLASPGANFSIVALPDTQNYVGTPAGAAIFSAQTQWAVTNQSSQAIAFVSHLGDIVNNGGASWNNPEWIFADTAMSKLDPTTVPPAPGIPYGLAVGKWDTWYDTYEFESHFGVSRFSGRPYYGGHFGTDNLNSFDVFDAGGMGFIVINLSCPAAPPPAGAVTWASDRLREYGNRRGIAVCHTLYAPTTAPAFSPEGQIVFDGLKDNPNLFLLLGAGVPGEFNRQDTYNGRTIYSMSADFSGRANGGDGWLRQLKFSPSANQIQVVTYSPTLNQTETDANSAFTLSYDMHYQALGGAANLASGARTSVTWPNLTPNTQYEWYAIVSDGVSTATSSTWTFTTAPAAAPSVTSQPADQIVNPGQTATFSAAASGNPAPTVQWRLSTDGGIAWNDITGATNTSYSVTAGAGNNGYLYQAVFSNLGGSVYTNPAVLMLSTQPAVTTHPANLTVNPGQPATFTASAGGQPTPSVQWQVSTNGGGAWTNISGATGTTYSFTTAATDNGKQFRAVFTNIAGTANSNAAILTVNQPPAVSTPPADLTVNATQTATFTAAASGSPTPTVQWQVSTNGGGAWTNISGATSTTYSFSTVGTDHGKQFHAVFTNVAGSATSSAATLTVNVAPAVTTEPANLTVNPGQTATFTAAASGRPTPTVQWQVSTNGGSTWTDISGANSTTYSFTAAAADSGKQFQAVFTNSVGSTPSSAATLTVNQAPTITTQPADLTVAVGQTAAFTAAASGNTTWSMQWQVSLDNGTSWTAIPGATNTTLSFTAAAADNGKQFRAVFTNPAGSATSSAARLTVNGSLVITMQPVSQWVRAGDPVSFSASATGNPPPTVQWQVSMDGGSTWANIPGATSSTYTFTTQAADNGKQFRAVYTNATGTATTDAAVLRRLFPLWLPVVIR